MRTIILLTTMLVLAAIPMAVADESKPDCEANQPWIGYDQSTPISDGVNQLGDPAGLKICEGEQWDGQDSVQPAATGSCTPTDSLDPNALFVDLCLGSDPNTMPGEVANAGALNPLGVRVSTQGTNAAYAGSNILGVGRAVLYVDHGTVAVYLRDNTPGNLLAQVVSAPRITQGHVDESDCDQATYQAGAEAHDGRCGRDNTAITVEFDSLA